MDIGPGVVSNEKMITMMDLGNKRNPLWEVFILPLVLYLHVLHSQPGLCGAHPWGAGEGLDGSTQSASITEECFSNGGTRTPRGTLKYGRGCIYNIYSIYDITLFISVLVHTYRSIYRQEVR